ncbi:hypothetical protein [Escherichia coli]|uniref:hypothetical protein n=1 Tax=Escherichia coli TaxID=562 RepID=UPI000E2C61DD|nr:hypothetical protein [Escherichia coli]MEC9928021.1 hypothetical protein [Escherichia marmotae]MEC9977820.1 hypothetical protein [Escherichia marmotae]MED0298494.1 hypothetical protein [Escherichia coli]MED0546886.1 hypothetical protein [Escherichia marmotae]MED8818369.1 hypothetical protein [Escherichia marmotae]
MEVKVIAKCPKNCDENELKTFKKLVIVGAEVDPVGLSGRISNAEHLFFIYAEEQCISMAQSSIQMQGIN